MAIMYCGCRENSEGSEQGAKYQDKKYGKGMRVFTDNKEGNPKSCTVCGREKK